MIDIASLHQLVVTSLLDNSSRNDSRDAVGVSHSRQPMSNHDRRSTLSSLKKKQKTGRGIYQQKSPRETVPYRERPVPISRSECPTPTSLRRGEVLWDFGRVLERWRRVVSDRQITGLHSPRPTYRIPIERVNICLFFY